MKEQSKISAERRTNKNLNNLGHVEAAIKANRIFLIELKQNSECVAGLNALNG